MPQKSIGLYRFLSQNPSLSGIGLSLYLGIDRYRLHVRFRYV